MDSPDQWKGLGLNLRSLTSGIFCLTVWNPHTEGPSCHEGLLSTPKGQLSKGLIQEVWGISRGHRSLSPSLLCNLLVSFLVL